MGMSCVESAGKANCKMEASKERIILNVGGIRHETYCTTLKAFPGTKLCQLTEPQSRATFDYDPHTKEFFFDRSAQLFGEVLYYYRTKHLHCPADICWPLWEEELAFWEIPLAELAPCCRMKLRITEGPSEEFLLRSSNDDYSNEDSQALLGQEERRDYRLWARWQPKMWALFNKPYSSKAAMCLMVISLLFNFGILILFFMEPTTNIDFTHYNDSREYIFHIAPKTSLQESMRLLYVELFCIFWFMFEFSIRLTFCPDKKKFLTNPLNIADFLSLFPVFIELFLIGHFNNTLDLLSWLGFFRVLYIIKLLKIFKLLDVPLTLRILPFTFRSILKEVFILIMIFTFEVLFFGALFFHAELMEPETHFPGIISSFYWAAITLTTVGYGDMYAVTEFGKVIACCTAICGILTMIIPIPILFIKFQSYYAMAATKEKLKSNKMGD